MTHTRRTIISAIGLVPLFPPSLAAQDAAPLPDGPAETIEPAKLASANAATVRGYMAALNRGDIPAAVAFFAPDTRNHGKLVGRPGLTRVLMALKTLFPDYHQEVVELTATGDVVVTRTSASGTHKGSTTFPVDSGMLAGVPPTGRSFTVQHIHWWRLKDGLIAEHYATRDDVGMLQQLGLLPSKPA